jgi:uncharacterized protein (TIGR04255 family)
MGRKYKNPPLVEAVCEFRLIQETHWDLTVPGLFYEGVKAEFPHREQRSFQELQIIHEPQGFRQELQVSERVFLFSPDRRLLIQIGPRLLVVNALKPYPTWQGFKPRIEMAWKKLQGIVEVQGLERIALQYINRIELPEKEGVVQLSDYFSFYPTIGPRLPREMALFIAGAEFSFKGGWDRCRVQLTPDTAGEKNALLLDVNYFLARPNSVKVSEALQWIEEAHTQVEEIFEGCITDKLRELFGEVK